MCCLCFERFDIEDLLEEDGEKVDVCKKCGEYEQMMIERKRNNDTNRRIS